MSYCVNCGVELSSGAEKCPLCDTKVINPNGNKDDKQPDPLYPPYGQHTGQQISRKSVVALLSLIALLPVSISIVCNISINGAVTWSGFVIAAIALVYIVTVIPIGLGKKHYITCLSADFIGILLFLLYIEFMTNGKWFLNFAMPIVVFIASVIISISGIASKRHIRTSILASVITFSTGIFCLFTEILLNLSFGIHDKLVWSLYPFITLTVLSAVIFVIGRNEPLKEKLEKKFFI